ncbi:MAG: pyrophosphohydrolase [Naasia sp.]|uniref:NUDIX domain-containing protein n=1 Tax=Naasia sp. TaxID=2546198 RepID=UPI0026219D65|nr:NUDIX hydrolase [Naasia sp.]MCU1569311.1 pyrophosphohydrolase [Naasia sp.]
MPEQPASVPPAAVHADGVGLPRRPLGSGDEWVELPDGRRFWGRYGAAGLLVSAPGAGVLLQHRAGYSHFGGTWGLPGGARHEDESAVQGAIREAAEEAGVPGGALRLRFASRLDLGVWSYTTVVATVDQAFPPVIGDAESVALRWVPLEEVPALPLHPGLADTWDLLRPLLEVRPTLVVDGANVVGSRPDGWWRDRVGAAARLRASLGALATAGVPGRELGLPAEHWWPEIVLVLEGQAKALEDDEDGPVRILRAERDGDSALAAFVQSSGPATTVVTADRALAARVPEASILRPGRLLELLDAVGGDS